jgi:hypothetical protein
MKFRIPLIGSGVGLGLVLVACGGTDVPGSTGGGDLATSGGAAGNGGATSIGGTVGSGGALNTGGAPLATGGVTSTGGTLATGGVTSTGGALATGGAKSTGGAPAGGVTSAGGAKATGGATNVGGATSAGGSKTTGGAKSTGGAPAGGVTSTGGAKATGGATNAGGATSAGGSKTTGGAKSTGGAASTGGATGTGGGSSTCANFSFFVTSLVAIRRESANPDGFGGDLGGLTGADAICTRIAANALPCAGQKTWRAFLSTSTVNAISRIGTGPWYDRIGRKVANTTTDLQNTRPLNGDASIANDLPNEFGVANHSPDGTTVDNHDTLTGSNSLGQFYGANSTCSDWTSTTATGGPRVGHSWPGGPSQHWINAMNAPGCARGINTSSQGNGNCANSTGATVAGVGCAGGYGGFYCFATTP